MSEAAWDAPAGKVEITRFLLEHKADPNMTGAQVRGLMSTQGHPIWQAGARFKIKICTLLRTVVREFHMPVQKKIYEKSCPRKEDKFV